MLSNALLKVQGNSLSIPFWKMIFCLFRILNKKLLDSSEVFWRGCSKWILLIERKIMRRVYFWGERNYLDLSRRFFELPSTTIRQVCLNSFLRIQRAKKECNFIKSLRWEYFMIHCVWELQLNNSSFPRAAARTKENHLKTKRDFVFYTIISKHLPTFSLGNASFTPSFPFYCQITLENTIKTGL